MLFFNCLQRLLLVGVFLNIAWVEILGKLLLIASPIHEHLLEALRHSLRFGSSAFRKPLTHSTRSKTAFSFGGFRFQSRSSVGLNDLERLFNACYKQHLAEIRLTVEGRNAPSKDCCFS